MSDQKSFRDYFRPGSVTWWVGIVLVVSGVLEISGGSVPLLTDIIRPVLKGLSEASDPVMRVLAGFGVIGANRKLEALLRGSQPRQ